jgi:hypothetical protein
MSKHTPGPWEAKNVGPHWNNKEIDNWIITYGKDDEQVVDHVYEEADARLIAAAPELLQACKDALATGEHDMQHILDNGRLRDVLGAAIAKATRVQL